MGKKYSQIVFTVIGIMQFLLKQVNGSYTAVYYIVLKPGLEGYGPSYNKTPPFYYNIIMSLTMKFLRETNVKCSCLVHQVTVVKVSWKVPHAESIYFERV